jgi:hypothetical protein
MVAMHHHPDFLMGRPNCLSSSHIADDVDFQHIRYIDSQFSTGYETSAAPQRVKTNREKYSRRSEFYLETPAAPFQPCNVSCLAPSTLQRLLLGPIQPCNVSCLAFSTLQRLLLGSSTLQRLLLGSFNLATSLAWLPQTLHLVQVVA